MSVMVASKPRAINQNVKNIFNYLDRQYPTTFDLEEIEQDIETGYTSLEKELLNAYKALCIFKVTNKNNQKICSTVNQFLKLLMKENRIN